MFNEKELEEIKKKKEEWEKDYYLTHKKKHPERKNKFENLSWTEIKNLYTPDDIAHHDYLKDYNFPGEYPFLRGLHPTMYRGRFWTFRQFSGFGSAEETNERYKYLLDHGETGLSVAFDYPTLYGYETCSYSIKWVSAEMDEMDDKLHIQFVNIDDITEAIENNDEDAHRIISNSKIFYGDTEVYDMLYNKTIEGFTKKPKQ